MAHLSIIGTGNMGQAIAAVAGRGGHTVQLLGQGDTATQVTGEIVVLAVPYPAVGAVLAERGESLAGIVAAGGLKAIDAGSLRRARELEALGFLQITLAAGEKISWTGGFGVIA